jgi:hypothetical protein
MRLNRSDAEQNGRAASVCKAYAKRVVSLQAASNQCLIDHVKTFDFRTCPRNGIFPPGFGTERSAMSMLTNGAERQT